jgi:acetyl esterase/lipase
MDFHQKIWNLAENRHLSAMLEQVVVPLLSCAARDWRRSAANMRRSAARHHMLADAIGGGAVPAGKAMRQHISEFLRAYSLENPLRRWRKPMKLVWISIAAATAAVAAPPTEFFYQSHGERKLRIVFHYPPDWARAHRRPVILFLSGGAHSPRDRDGNPYPLAAERTARRMPVVNGGPGKAFDVEADYFARRGMVAGRVEYRQRKEDGVLPDESTRDAALAIRWVRAHAAELGVDPRRVVGVGGSGGAHLVASVAAMPDLHGVKDSMPDAMILHYPLLDWLEGGSMTERFLDALNSDRELALRLSPARHWHLKMPPTLLFIGGREPTFETNRAFAEKWIAAGARLELFIGEEAPHGFSTVSPWIEKATMRSDAFLRKLGYLGDRPQIEPPARQRPKKGE